MINRISDEGNDEVDEVELDADELDVLRAALRDYYDNLLDDHHEGGDHGDAIDLLEGLNYKLRFIEGL